MAVGGYAIIDFKGANISDQGTTIPGAYKAVERQMGKKPILFRNFSIASKDYVPVYASPTAISPGGGHTAFLVPVALSLDGTSEGFTIRDDDLVAHRVIT